MKNECAERRSSAEADPKAADGKCTMEHRRVIEVKQNILAANDAAADSFRAKLAAQGTHYTDVMASPGAGKTTLLLALIERLRAHGSIGIIEADLESFVDSEKIKAAGIPAVQLQTQGVCHVEMGMVERAWNAFAGQHFDHLFLENIGNLVCPADFDTGAHTRIMLLSVPEGYDKVYKYPPMFEIVDALVVTKTDYLPLNPDFDMEALHKQARVLNRDIKIFETCARTGEGVDELAAWLEQRRNTVIE